MMHSGTAFQPPAAVCGAENFGGLFFQVKNRKTCSEHSGEKEQEHHMEGEVIKAR